MQQLILFNSIHHVLSDAYYVPGTVSDPSSPAAYISAEVRCIKHSK